MMDEMQRVYAKSTKHTLLNPQKGMVSRPGRLALQRSNGGHCLLLEMDWRWIH